MQRWRIRRDDAGFGLAELMVAMTIMAIILMALAPFLVSAFKTTARNVRIAGATQLVNQRIDLAQGRSASASCQAFNTFLATHDDPAAPGNIVDDPKRSITYVVEQGYNFTLATCSDLPSPHSDPLIESTFYYVVEVVSKDDPTVVLAKGATWIAVPGFGS